MRCLIALLAGGAALVASGASTAEGQARPTATVRVTVTDSAGKPIAGADVALVRGLKDSVARGATDNAGVHTFVIPTDDNPYQVIVRRIGYYRADRFFSLRNRESVTVPVDMRHVIQALAEVRVRAMADPKRRAYFIDADEIENSPRLLLDASDIVTKLKPDMAGGRVPPGMDPNCAGMREIWVNGRRIWAAMVVPNDLARQRMKGQTGRRGQQTTVARLGANNMTILMEIHPEHIAEMTFRDCMDTVMKGTGQKNALFIVLKPGIAYQPGRESYAVDNGPPPPRRPVAGAPGQTPQATQVARLLGVFDDETGGPVDGAEVIDIASGTIATTTKTGTVSLAFLHAGDNEIRVQKPGFRDSTLAVHIGPTDTIPITLVIRRARSPQSFGEIRRPIVGAEPPYRLEGRIAKEPRAHALVSGK